jgi:hypothetical protein
VPPSRLSGRRSSRPLRGCVPAASESADAYSPERSEIRSDSPSSGRRSRVTSRHDRVIRYPVNNIMPGRWYFLVVEVAGIEPASFSFSMGLLRAHPTVKSQIPPRHRPRRRIPANLVFPRRHIGDANKVSPTRCRLNPTRKAGVGQTSLLFRQRARAVARHLFWFPAL